MTTNDRYSKAEVDSKFETVQQKIVTLETSINGKLDGLKKDMELILTIMKDKFETTDKRIGDLQGWVMATGIGLLIALVGTIIPIAWTLWSNVIHPH